MRPAGGVFINRGVTVADNIGDGNAFFVLKYNLNQKNEQRIANNLL